MTVSAKDTTILALLSRFPEMPDHEVDGHLSKMEHQDNVLLAKAVVGRVSPEELPEDTRRVYDEFMEWSQRRTAKTRREQQHAERRGQETKLAKNLKRAYEQGRIPIETLLTFGISGTNMEELAAMPPQERQEALEKSYERNLGSDWRHYAGGRIRVRTLPPKPKQSWKDGF